MGLQNISDRLTNATVLEQPTAQHGVNFPVTPITLVAFFLYFLSLFSPIRGCHKYIYLFLKVLLEIGSWDGFAWETEGVWRCIASDRKGMHPE